MKKAMGNQLISKKTNSLVNMAVLRIRVGMPKRLVLGQNIN